MRTSLLLMIAAVLLAACSGSSSQSSTSPSVAQPTATIATKLIAIHPCELPLPAHEMIPGKFEVRQGELATAQCSRSWDGDIAVAGTTQRIAILGRLYPTLPDAEADFAAYARGEGGRRYVTSVIAARGFFEHQINVSEVTNLPPLGVDDQAAWRVEFTRGTAAETWVEYFLFVRVKNTRAQIQVVGQNAGGAEAKGLFDDAQRVVKKQAERLLAIPATADPVTPTRVPTGVIEIPLGRATPTPTSRP